MSNQRHAGKRRLHALPGWSAGCWPGRASRAAAAPLRRRLSPVRKGGAKKPLAPRRTAQAGPDSGHPVVVRKQRGQLRQRREAVQPDQLVVAEIDAPKLILQSASQRPGRAAAPRRACVTARFSTVLSFSPAEGRNQGCTERRASTDGARGCKRQPGVAHRPGRTRLANAAPDSGDGARKSRPRALKHSPLRSIA